MSRQTYSAKELGEALGVSESKAYSYIRIMNSELESKGFLTVRGKVSRAYADKRFFGGLSEEEGNGGRKEHYAEASVRTAKS